ncbi:hypothetical protein A3Q56_08709 [Intoshia linei]|uniref:Uncharacterized protein n=1 Tax=Intoshia linei TaxID=1819745 RepID=A0A177AQC9_9BILA|nr:hypothetical protein A3Q56_08709 [Intoshia linei]
MNQMNNASQESGENGFSYSVAVEKTGRIVRWFSRLMKRISSIILELSFVLFELKTIPRSDTPRSSDAWENGMERMLCVIIFNFIELSFQNNKIFDE